MASGKQIDEEQFVRNIGLAIIAYKIITAIIIWLILPSRIISTVFQSLYAIGVAVFMIFGNSKARWFFVLGGIFISIFAVFAFFRLGDQNISKFSIPGFYLLFSASVEFTIAIFLIFSARVNKFFGT